MYLPNHSTVKDASQIARLIRQNSFAMLLSFPLNERPFINHLPVIFDPEAANNDILIGHMSRHNPQWRHFQNHPAATLIFQGPQGYISPRWYKSGRDVPTWNYAVVHLHGQVELSENFDEQLRVLKAMSHSFDETWKFELPVDLCEPEALEAAIVSFKFRCEETEAKFKLSANRSEADRLGVIEGLQQQGDDMSRALCALMDGR